MRDHLSQDSIHQFPKTDVMSIKEKFKNHEFTLGHSPRILEMDHTRIFINKDAPNPNELASFQDFLSYREETRLLTHKLKVESYGDWEMGISVISTIYFDDRHSLDKFYCRFFDEYEEFGTISIRDAIYECGVEISCNMDFYLKHPTEIELDLNRSVDVCLIKDDAEAMQRLEEELFYNLMCSLFGEDVDDDYLEKEKNGENDGKFKKVCTVKEFAILYKDGNDVYATGKRGDNYLLFRYGTS